MSLSLFVLALYVFLQSSVALGWFTADPKFTATVGILFVVIVVFESLFLTFRGRPFLSRRAD